NIPRLEPSLTSIHRSAWKLRSPKYECKILDIQCEGSQRQCDERNRGVSAGINLRRWKSTEVSIRPMVEELLVKPRCLRSHSARERREPGRGGFASQSGPRFF